MPSTLLKIIALVLMFIDHVGQFFPATPIWLRWLGRVSAPLFFFASAWGFFHTRNRKRYLLNLYGWGVFMAAGALGLTLLLPPIYTAMPINNIFVTLLLAWVVVQIVEDFVAKRTKRAVLLLGGLLVVQAASIVLTSFFMGLTGNLMAGYFVAATLPSLLMCEGSLTFVGLGVCLYFTRKNPVLLCVGYLGFCAIFLYPAWQAPLVENLFFRNFQWLMVGALPLMLCYNGKKGHHLKWLFYVFYPAHVYVLYVVGTLVAKG